MYYGKLILLERCDQSCCSGAKKEIQVRFTFCVFDDGSVKTVMCYQPTFEFEELIARNQPDAWMLNYIGNIAKDESYCRTNGNVELRLEILVSRSWHPSHLNGGSHMRSYKLRLENKDQRIGTNCCFLFSGDSILAALSTYENQGLLRKKVGEKRHRGL